MILHGPVSPDSRHARETGPLPINQWLPNCGGRDDRSGDAGCTHTDSVGPELPRDSLSCQLLAIISSVSPEN
jgi:hypothetical protein